MNVTLKQIRAFAALAQSRSFAEAAARLHLSQPALSNALKTLEDTVGGQLLARTTRTFALTPEGEDFYPVALRLLKDWDEALDDLHSRFALRFGKISIASMPSFAGNLLPIAIRRYKADYPDVNIALHDVIAEEVVAMVRSGRAEMGISFDPGEHDDLCFTPLFTDTFIAILPLEHPLAAQSRVSAADLLRYDFIALQPPSRVRKLINDKLAERNLILTPTFETHQLMTIGRMVANGLGLSIAPSLCQQQMLELGACWRPLTEPAITEQVGIVTRYRYPLSAAAQAMAETLQQTFAETGNRPLPGVEPAPANSR